MEKLAPISIRAVLSLMKLQTNFSFIVRGQMLFFMEFVVSMGKWAGGLVLALAIEFPRFADFCLVFHLIVFDKGFSFFFITELSFSLFNGGLEVLVVLLVRICGTIGYFILVSLILQLFLLFAHFDLLLLFRLIFW